MRLEYPMGLIVDFTQHMNEDGPVDIQKTLATFAERKATFHDSSIYDCDFFPLRCLSIAMSFGCDVFRLRCRRFVAYRAAKVAHELLGSTFDAALTEAENVE